MPSVNCSASFPPVPCLALLLLLLLNVPSSSSLSQQCPSPVFRSLRWTANANASQSPVHLQQPSPFHFFALTQDCQFMIARPDQLNKFSSLNVSPHSRQCHPSRVQLLWSLASGQPSLLLLQRRSASELCILPVEMPTPLAFYGAELFSYSLRSALAQFAKCSCPMGVPNNSRLLPAVDPQLIFPDSLYSDLFYQLSPSPSSSNWTLQQLRLSPRGHFDWVEQFRVRAMANGRRGEDLLLAIDAQRKRLFAMPRRVDGAHPMEWTCPFDLLFRPDLAKFHQIPLFPNEKPSPGSILTGFSLDRHIAVFTLESGRHTELFLAKLKADGQAPETRCVLRMGFGAKFGVISGATLKELAVRGPLPAMGPGERARSASRTPASTDLPAAFKGASTASPIWYKYTKASTTARPSWPVANGQRRTTKMGQQPYFWHRTPSKGTEAVSSSEATNTTRTRTSTEAGIQADEEVEGWSEDYEEEGEEAEGEGQKPEAAGGEEERLLPLPAEGEEAEKEEKESPTPAQMVREEAEKAKESANAADLVRPCPFLALALAWLLLFG